MILRENDILNLDKKVVLDCCYVQDGRITMVGFTPYYDLGDGFYMDYNEREATLTGSKLKSAPFREERDRMFFIKELYARALQNKYPIFLRFEGDFIFLNEFRFNKPSPKEERKAVIKKQKEIAKLMDKHMKKDQLVGAEVALNNSKKMKLKNTKC